MSASLYRLVLALLLLGFPTLMTAGEPEVANPFYAFWAKSKPGATASLKETTKLSGVAAEAAGAKSDEKLLTYKLTELTPEKAVVETVVTQRENFGYVQSAPTKHIYPSKMSKADLEDLIKETGAKGVAATLKVGDKELKVLAIAGSMKSSDGEDVDFKLWVSDEVPGGIVRRIRTTKVNGAVVAETTTQLISFKKDN